MRKIQMDCLPGLSGRLAHLQSSNILTTKMKSLLAELNMRYFNSANRSSILFRTTSLKSTLSALTANLQTKGSIVASVLLPSILTLF